MSDKDYTFYIKNKCLRAAFLNNQLEKQAFRNGCDGTVTLESGSGSVKQASAYDALVLGATITTPAELAVVLENSACPDTTVPDAPTATMATPGNTQATVTFSAPADDGGAPITGYTVTASPGGATATGATSPLTVTGLTNGVSYTFTVTATNEIGTGPSSAASAPVIPATVPGAPSELTADAGNAEATVTFSAPTDNGGAAITNYEYSLDNGTTWSAFSPVITSGPVTITGLTNGTGYQIKLRAVNSIGAGAASATLRITPTPFSGMMLLLDGALREEGSVWYDYSGKNTNATLVGSPVWSLANGGRYEFNGSSQYAQLPAGFADFTSGLTVLAIVDMGAASTWERIIDFGNGQASDNIVLSRRSSNDEIIIQYYSGGSVGFSAFAPASITNNNWNFFGARLDGSTYKLNADSIVASGEAGLPLNITRTNNFIGRSNWSGDALFERYMSVLAVFNTALSDSEVEAFLDYYRGRYVPGAPTGLVASAGDGEATITFTPGSNNGAAITNYMYSIDGVNYIALSPADTSSPVTIGGLTNDVTYNITLKAKNAFGDSVASSSVAVTPSLQTLFRFTTAGSGTWTAPDGITSIEYLIVGGGGGGGGAAGTGSGGGGGGGAVKSGTMAVTPGATYNYTVGSGGAAGAGGVNNSSDGSASIFDTITAGGGGRGFESRFTNETGILSRGGAAQAGDIAPTGGSGGGTRDNNAGGGTGGAGGGGGSGGAGGNGVDLTPGDAINANGGPGGVGITNTIDGTATVYGAGGAGGNEALSNITGAAGAANTGRGGGGAQATSMGGSSVAGGAGGSGIIIINTIVG